MIAAILAAVALQYAIPDRYGLHPRWLIPSLELVLLAVLSMLNPLRLTRSTTLAAAPATPWWPRSPSTTVLQLHSWTTPS